MYLFNNIFAIWSNKCYTFAIRKKIAIFVWQFIYCPKTNFSLFVAFWNMV